MSSKGAQEFVHRLEALKGGDKGLLRGLRGSRLDDRLRGFDLFTGIWWTIRQKNAGAPRREPAWLVVKLFSCNPIPSADGEAFPVLLARLSKTDSSVQREFDAMIGLSLDLLEPAPVAGHSGRYPERANHDSTGHRGPGNHGLRDHRVYRTLPAPGRDDTVPVQGIRAGYHAGSCPGLRQTRTDPGHERPCPPVW